MLTVMNRPDTYRSFCIMNIVDALITRLQSKKQSILAQRLHEIALLNQAKIQCNTPTFLYNGKKCSVLNWVHGKDDNKLLHASFCDDVHTILRGHTFEDIEYLSKLKQYLCEVFTTVNTKKALFKVFPIILHDIIDSLDATVYDLSPAITEEALQHFITTHTEGSILIKQYLTMDLLL